MKTPDQMALDEIQAIFAAANTPLFLLRKLRAHREVQRINLDCDPHDILEALNNAVLQRPQTLEELVRPYAYLVALSLNQTKSYLERGTRVPAPYHDWFKYIGIVLLKIFQSTSHTIINVAPSFPKQDSPFQVTTLEKSSVFTQETDK